MIFLSILILIVAIALPSINKNIRTILYVRISSIIFIYAGALAFNAFYIQSIGSGIGIYSGLFQVTVISQLLDVFIFLIGSFILISWPSYSTKINVIDSIPYAREYSLIVLFSSLGASLLVSSADLISMYLSIELQSFGVYILSTLYRNSESATSAGLKYFLLGSLSSCLILLGSGIVYTYSGLTHLESIYNLISVSENTQILQGITLGIVLIIVGYLFKVSAAPLHNWAPDVYDDSPTIVTIWLTIMPKISILIFLLEIQSQIGNSLLTVFSFSLKNVLLISSLLSLIIGTVVGLAQSRIKRLFAYSTISHIGFILLALAINTEQSIDSFLFYIIQYSLTNLNTFLILIGLGYILKNQSILESFQDIKYITELKGLFFNNPVLSLSLTICLFSMAGVPPLLGFFSKQFVLYSAMQSEYYFIGIIAILVSVISASYYLKIIKVLHTENKEIVEDSNSQSPLSSFHSFMISTLTLFILFFILKPSILLNSTQLLALSLFYY
uniref:NADH-ubiquinone oxidoreductase chain 2 n=1 Tax=Trametes versicolor TaxID=5325 RepID=A0A7S8WV02_TRAVE|nr:NADH dehydrogenase subunit 2 [Trametes versicolor]QPF23602.1 NADH dehydrogenase subunit 2 [Trametes versicolor]WVH38333.1 NADH dehydrogenase subunit 2 [Trametes versicolor]